jgi:hypothetical protein
MKNIKEKELMLTVFSRLEICTAPNNFNDNRIFTQYFMYSKDFLVSVNTVEQVFFELGLLQNDQVTYL